MQHRFTVHVGGDSPDSLKQQFLDVMDAARKLDEALRKAAPNGRNYYVRLTAEEDFRDDRNEFETMLARAEAVRKWAEEGAMRVLEQGDK